MTPDPLPSIVDLLSRGDRFVLASHERPDGDSIGSQLALAHALQHLGKTVRIVNRDPPPAGFDVIPGVSAIEVRDEVDGRADAAIVLECSSLDRTGVAGLDRQPVVNIDHHAGNAMYGRINWFDPTAAACAEMVHDLVTALGAPLTRAIGTALYVGVLTDTGSFRHAHITARTFEVCRQAAAAGVDPAGVADAVFQRSTTGKLRLTGALLQAMRLDAGGRLAILRVDDALLRATGCPPDDLDGVVNLPLASAAIEAVILLKTLDGETRASLRSKGDVDVRAVAAAFGGGGHRNAAGVTLAEPAARAEARLVARTTAALDLAAAGRPGAPTP